MVDEAHATGVFGPQGRGCVEAEGLAGQVDLVMGTFSKALGGFGAYLAASRTVIDTLVNTARSFIYSTALPPTVIAADLAALRLCLAGETRGEELLRRAGGFRSALRGKGWTVGGESQIVPVLVGRARLPSPSRKDSRSGGSSRCRCARPRSPKGRPGSVSP